MLPSILACCKQQSKYSIDPEGVKDSDKTYASNLFDDISCYLIEYPNGTTLLKREFGVTIFSIFNTFVFFSFLAIRSQIIRCQTNDHCFNAERSRNSQNGSNLQKGCEI